MAEQFNLGRVKGYSAFEEWVLQSGNENKTWEDFEAYNKGIGIVSVDVVKSDFDTATLDNTHTLKITLDNGNVEEVEITTKSVQGPTGATGIQGVQGVSGVSADMSSDFEVVSSSTTISSYSTKTITLNQPMGEFSSFICSGSSYGILCSPNITNNTITVRNMSSDSATITIMGMRKAGQISDPSVIGPQGVQGIQGPAGEDGYVSKEMYEALVARIEELEGGN